MQVEKHGLAAPLLNGRNLTNSGTFRAYCLKYLRDHSDIHKQGMTFLVETACSHREKDTHEIYVFVSDVRWVHYEAIQSDIFDHLLSSLPIFGLESISIPH